MKILLFSSSFFLNHCKWKTQVTLVYAFTLIYVYVIFHSECTSQCVFITVNE